MAISTKKGNTLMFLRWWEISIENSGVNFFWFIDNSLEVINAIKCKRYTVSEINTSDFSTLYTSFLLYLVKRNLIGLVEKFFAREKTTFVVVSKNKAFFSDNKYNNCFYYTSLEIFYAKALYQSGCYFVWSHCYITRSLRETTNGLLLATFSPVTSLSFSSRHF